MRVTDALEATGLSVSDGQRMPFEVKVPNKATLDAIKELRDGRGKKFDSINSLIDDLNADD